MPHDARLAERVRRATARRRAVSEKAMFGGVAFLLDGKMFCGVASDDLMVRVGPEAHEACLAKPQVRPMDVTGRPMKGYVFVGPAGCRTQRQVAGWVERGASFVATVEARRRPRRRKRR
jgi:TfoX/Sxy family transcriptional regulator of competence genes